MRISADIRRLGLGLVGIVALTLLFMQWTRVTNAATIALSFLIVVLFVAANAALAWDSDGGTSIRVRMYSNDTP